MTGVAIRPARPDELATPIAIDIGLLAVAEALVRTCAAARVTPRESPPIP